jgi:hypothetical protein
MLLKMCSDSKRKEAESRETGTCVARGEAYVVYEGYFVPGADVIGRVVDLIGVRKLRGLRIRVYSLWLVEADLYQDSCVPYVHCMSISSSS